MSKRREKSTRKLWMPKKCKGVVKTKLKTGLGNASKRLKICGFGAGLLFFAFI